MYKLLKLFYKLWLFKEDINGRVKFVIMLHTILLNLVIINTYNKTHNRKGDINYGSIKIIKRYLYAGGIRI